LLLGVAIPYVNPRSGRTGSLVMAMLTFFIYYNLINLSRNTVASGQWSMPGMLFILHVPVTVLGLIGLWWRSEQINLLQTIRQIFTFKRGAA
jgi:lipopolysaccharide export system permease protein